MGTGWAGSLHAGVGVAPGRQPGPCWQRCRMRPFPTPQPSCTLAAPARGKRNPAAFRQDGWWAVGPLLLWGGPGRILLPPGACRQPEQGLRAPRPAPSQQSPPARESPAACQHPDTEPQQSFFTAQNSPGAALASLGSPKAPGWVPSTPMPRTPLAALWGLDTPKVPPVRARARGPGGHAPVPCHHGDPPVLS